MKIRMSIQFLKGKLLRNFALVFLGFFVLNATGLSVAHSRIISGATVFISSVSKQSSKGSSTSQVRLEIPKSYLCETLSDLNKKSGVEFKCPDRLQNHLLFPRVLEEKDWVSLIRVLLEDYSIIEMWNQSGKLTKVYLVGDKGLNTRGPQGKRKVGTTSERDNKTVASGVIEGIPGSSLTKSQLFVLLQTSTYRPMPSHIFNSADYKELLGYAGIESPKDWLDLKKSKRLKLQVQKLIKSKKPEKRH